MSRSTFRRGRGGLPPHVRARNDAKALVAATAGPLALRRPTDLEAKPVRYVDSKGQVRERAAQSVLQNGRAMARMILRHRVRTGNPAPFATPQDEERAKARVRRWVRNRVGRLYRGMSSPNLAKMAPGHIRDKAQLMRPEAA